MSGSISVPVRPCAMAENMYGTPAPASAFSLCSVFLSVGACSVGANEEGRRGKMRGRVGRGRGCFAAVVHLPSSTALRKNAG